MKGSFVLCKMLPVLSFDDLHSLTDEQLHLYGDMVELIVPEV